jgi:ubiquinone/menaquinone biosynthesis C-methylase UbiE
MVENRNKLLEDRKLKEVEHSNRRRSIVTAYEYRTDTRSDGIMGKFVARNTNYGRHFSNMRFYSIAGLSFEHRDQLLYEGIKGATALDYCCGNGEIAVEMAKRGARKVVGIDISEVAVTNARKLAEINNVQQNCKFVIMDAESTDFSSGTFDVIHEYGALHHLHLPCALRELHRILKPNGRIVCTEALRHNPLIHFYRRLTPHLRTRWEFEHILGVSEIMQGLRYFEDVTIQFFHFAGLFAVPFRKSPYFGALLAILERIDNAILSIPNLQRLAWVAVFTYANPKKCDPPPVS